MENQSRQASRTRRPSLIRASIEGSFEQGSVRAPRFWAGLVVRGRNDDGLSCHWQCHITHVDGLIRSGGLSMMSWIGTAVGKLHAPRDYVKLRGHVP